MVNLKVCHVAHPYQSSKGKARDIQTWIDLFNQLDEWGGPDILSAVPDLALQFCSFHCALRVGESGIRSRLSEPMLSLHGSPAQIFADLLLQHLLSPTKDKMKDAKLPRVMHKSMILHPRTSFCWLIMKRENDFNNWHAYTNLLNTMNVWNFLGDLQVGP